MNTSDGFTPKGMYGTAITFDTKISSRKNLWGLEFNNIFLKNVRGFGGR